MHTVRDLHCLGLLINPPPPPFSLLDRRSALFRIVRIHSHLKPR